MSITMSSVPEMMASRDAAPLELPQRVVRAVEVLELTHRIHDFAARRAGA